MRKLFAHQDLIVKEGRTHALLGLGTGTGKTMTALLLARRHGTRALVIGPKITKEVGTWHNECIALGINPSFVTMVSREEFRRDWAVIPYHDVLIGDEAHTLMGAYPTKHRKNKVWVPKASQICEAMMGWAGKHKPKAIYLCSATPDRNPMVIWAMGVLLGRDWDFATFREKFYWERNHIWMLRTTQKEKELLGETVRSLGYAYRLEDCFDVPEQTFKTEYFDLTTAQKDEIKKLKLEVTDPLAYHGAVHQIENGHRQGNKYRESQHFASTKHERILELAAEFPKLLIFAKYTLQIEGITALLRGEGYTVMQITGQTKPAERKGFDKRADAMERVIVVVQSTISEGYQLPTFPCTVFASTADGWVHYDQAIGRTLRADHLKKNLYIFLVSRGSAVKKDRIGGVDEAAYKNMMLKKDFSMQKYIETL
jgi:superfamily II DNA or RNA helicase